MTLTDHFAKDAGVLTSPPEFPSVYTSIPDGKYITICSGSFSPSRIYDWYKKAIDLLPASLLEDYKFVQIGDAADYPIHGAIDLRGKVDIRQIAYVIERSSLHVGNDHVCIHISGCKNIPFVGLCAVTNKSAFIPKYKGKFICLEPEREGKPSYAAEETPKSINLIRPEDVAASICEILNLPYSKAIKTLKVGPLFNEERLDVITDFPVAPKLLDGRNLVCRYDLSPNPQALTHFYTFYGGALFTDRPVDIKIIEAFQSKIPHICYFLDGNYSKEFIHFLHISGIPYDLISFKTGDNLGKLKLDLFDFNQIKTPVVHDIENITAETRIDTNRLFLSQGRFYSSIWHWRNGIVSSPDNCVGNPEDRELQESWNHFHFYENCLTNQN